MRVPPFVRHSLPRRGTMCLIAAAVVSASAGPPRALAAQATPEFGVALRGGSVGFGAEVSLRLGERLGVRGGLGWLPFEYESTWDDTRYSVAPPGRYTTLAADLTLIGPLRLVGGVLHRSGPVTFEADLEGQSSIGDGTYDTSGRLTGQVESARTAPFVGIGLGQPAGDGFGLFVDLAVAFTGEPDLALEASGPITESPGFQADLERERQRAEAELDTYYRHWPIVSVGVRLPVG